LRRVEERVLVEFLLAKLLRFTPHHREIMKIWEGNYNMGGNGKAVKIWDG